MDYRISLIFTIVCLAGCGEPQCYPESLYPNYTSFAPVQEPVTAADQAILERVEVCLDPLRTQWLSPEEAREAQCYGQPVLVIRTCIRVAVAPNWYVSPYSGEQIFPCSVPNASCEAKGQKPDAAHPCYCRAMIQDNTTIWITPNRKLLPAYAVTLLTGCNNPWTKTLGPCSSPSLAQP